MSRVKIDRVDREIFASIFRARRPLSIRQLVYRIGYSWATINRHVSKLEGVGILEVRRTVRRSWVSIERSYWNKLKRMGY